MAPPVGGANGLLHETGDIRYAACAPLDNAPTPTVREQRKNGTSRTCLANVARGCCG